MFKTAQTFVHAAIAVLLGMGAIAAHAATYQVLGGTFHFQGSSVVTSLTGVGNLVENSYQGNDSTSTAFFLETLDEYGIAIHTYSAGPALAPTINLDTMQADMRSFNTAEGIDYHQGAITSVTHLSGNDYQLSWSSLFTPVNAYESGSYDGYTGFWTMTVRAPAPAPVPLPSAVWLLGAGLASFAGFMRRRHPAS